MSFHSFVRRALPAVTALIVMVAVTPTGLAAAAADDREPQVQGFADCDPATGEWVVRWHITNTYPLPADIDRVVIAPEGTKARDMPTVVAAGSTVVTGEHRLPYGVTWGSLQLHLTWTDGVEGGVWWPIYIYDWCTPAG